GHSETTKTDHRNTWKWDGHACDAMRDTDSNAAIGGSEGRHGFRRPPTVRRVTGLARPKMLHPSGRHIDEDPVLPEPVRLEVPPKHRLESIQPLFLVRLSDEPPHRPDIHIFEVAQHAARPEQPKERLKDLFDERHGKVVERQTRDNEVV